MGLMVWQQIPVSVQFEVCVLVVSRVEQIV